MGSLESRSKLGSEMGSLESRLISEAWNWVLKWEAWNPNWVLKIGKAKVQTGKRWEESNWEAGRIGRRGARNWEARCTNWEAKYDILRGEVHELGGEVHGLAKDVSSMKVDLAVVKTDMKWIKNQLGGPAA